MTGGFLEEAVVYLGAAVIAVPLAKKLGLGSVLGYLLAGVAIGPFLIGVVGEEGQDIMHFAEFGVVMMLFLVGLELQPRKFWHMKNSILGLGAVQLLVTSLLLVLAGALVFHFSLGLALSLSLALSMSSTAIALQTLKEKGLMGSASGQSSFAVLLFQDIAVIPILALLPMLAVSNTHVAIEDGGHGLQNISGGLKTALVIGAVGTVILVGKYAVVPLLRVVAKTKLRELFSASALLIVVAIAWLMEMVGLSPALGTFLAGVVLANSEFKHELESDLEPFKGLLLGLFFMAVGASINFRLISENPGLILCIAFGVMVIKAGVLFGLGKFFKLSISQNLIFTLALCQTGEFAFVLFSFVQQLGISDAHWTSIMMAVTAITMFITPILLLINEKWLQPKMGGGVQDSRPSDVIEENNPVIIAGFGHFGSTVGRFLRANGIEATIMDNDSDQVDLLRKMGFKVYYGDVTRVDLLESAGAGEAKIFISAIGNPETNLELIEILKKHFPNLELIIRAKNRFDGYQVLDLGVDNVYRDSLYTSIQLGIDVLQKMGQRKYTATRMGQNFARYDEEALRELAKARHNKKHYISKVREKISLQEELLQEDSGLNPSENDHAWDSEEMRNAILQQPKN